MSFALELFACGIVSRWKISRHAERMLGMRPLRLRAGKMQINIFRQIPGRASFRVSLVILVNCLDCYNLSAFCSVDVINMSDILSAPTRMQTARILGRNNYLNNWKLSWLKTQFSESLCQFIELTIWSWAVWQLSPNIQLPSLVIIANSGRRNCILRTSGLVLTFQHINSQWNRATSWS